MAYRILYTEESPQNEGHAPKNSRIIPFSVAFFLLFVLLTGQVWPEGRDALEEILLPGDPKVTKPALARMIDDLKQGEAPGDALITFCREIMDGADLSD